MVRLKNMMARLGEALDSLTAKARPIIEVIRIIEFVFTNWLD